MSQKANIHVDEKLVIEIASLARLDLSQEETEMFVSQFRDILDYVGKCPTCLCILGEQQCDS
jgi:Asp-tRNA(Asn)/Glu-tRNA(Gln) amidotransferase C subunit